MRAFTIVSLIVLTVVATTGVLTFARRRLARANLNRVIARFERDLAAPPLWPTSLQEESADDRLLGRNE